VRESGGRPRAIQSAEARDLEELSTLGLRAASWGERGLSPLLFQLALMLLLDCLVRGAGPRVLNLRTSRSGINLLTKHFATIAVKIHLVVPAGGSQQCLQI